MAHPDGTVSNASGAMPGISAARSSAAGAQEAIDHVGAMVTSWRPDRLTCNWAPSSTSAPSEPHGPRSRRRWPGCRAARHRIQADRRPRRPRPPATIDRLAGRRRSSRISRAATSRPQVTERRIDAALEAVAGIGLHVERAAGGGGAHGVEQRRSRRTRRRSPRCRGRLAAHDAAQRLRPRSSATTVISGPSSYSLPFSATSRSPSRARRTWMPPVSLSASKTCSGRQRSSVR